MDKSWGQRRPLKAQYDEIYAAISSKLEALLKKLKKSSGIGKEIESVITESFRVKKEDILIALGRLDREIKKDSYKDYSALKYKTIFNQKVIDFLKNPDFENLIAEYSKIYEQILDKSTYFKKGVFNHSNAEVIAKNLKSNGWFESGHSVNLNSEAGRNEIKTEGELVAAIDDEKKRILTDPKLSELFNKVDGALSTAELREFRDYILENPFIVQELKDVDAFRQHVWVAYLVELKGEYFDLMEEYDKGEEKIRAIITAAEAEQTSWERVIEIFNRRFSVPFEVRVENKGDAVLNLAAPQIAFYFKDDVGTPSKKTDRSILDSVLSNGEKRALYILNIIFGPMTSSVGFWPT